MKSFSTKRIPAFVITVTACILFFSNTLKAQPQLSFSSFIKNLNSPVAVTNADDGSNRLFIAERAGIIKIYKNGAVLAKPFLDISNLVSIVGNDQGFLSIAFHPKYESNRTFFVLYTATNNNVVLATYKTSSSNPDSAVNSGKIMISLVKEGGSLGRNGGDLHFGTDKFLYVSFGDGGTGTNTFGNPQDGQVFYGKILRLKTNAPAAPYYTVPPDNPFVNDPNIRDEIWALGLRQPWRWSFDRLTGDMWIGDVGQSKREEVSFRSAAQSAGTNYGWPCYEGDITYKLDGCGDISNYLFPVLSYVNNSTSGGHAVMGGYVYRGNTYPSMQGYYICADYVTRNVWKINPDGSGGWNIYTQPGDAPADIVGFGEDEDGELYAVSIGGKIYKVQATAAPANGKEPSAITAIDLKSYVYPTMVNNGTVTLELKEAYRQVRVIDIAGNEVMVKTLSNTPGTVVLNLPNLNAGMYIIRLTGNRNMEQKIFITNK